MSDDCVWCHPLDGRNPGTPRSAGCVNEHIVTLIVCDPCLQKRMRRVKHGSLYMFCRECKKATDIETTVSFFFDIDEVLAT